jgi:predicted dehydrogenase
MSRRLRFGILGTGNIARQFCTGVGGAARVELAAVGSRTQKAAQAFAQSFNISRIHASYDELLNDRDIDAIYISLPNSLHHEWTLKALQAGKHVLCEKPLAVTAREGEEMFAAARRAKKLLVEAFMYVSHPQTKRVLETVRSGAIGELRLIRASFCYRTSRIDGNIRFDPKLAGGALMDVGCYCTHFAQLIAGSAPASAHAAARLHPSGVDDATSGVLRFADGLVATFSCGMSTQCDNTAHICGTEGYLEIPWPWKPQRSSTYTLAHSIPPKQDKGSTNQSPRQTFTVEAPGELYELEANDFAATVLDGAPPAVSEQQSLANLRVLEDLRRQIGLKF